MSQRLPALTALAALRSEPWAILPDYLRAAEAILARAPEAEVLRQLAADGHAERHQETLRAVAALGERIEGTRRATLRDGVAVVPLLGVMAPRADQMQISSGGTALDTLAADLRTVEASPDVREVLLLVDSPGGQVTGTAALAGVVAGARKPITAYVQGSAASAAYWVASQAREIVTDATGRLGSIGVVVSIGRQVGPDRDGWQYHEIVSSGAPDKRPDPTTEDGRLGVTSLLDSLEREFVDAVAAGRRVSAETVRRDFGRGGTLAGREAVSAGMADRIDSLEATITRLAQRARTTTAGSRRAASSTSSRGAGRMDPDTTPASGAAPDDLIIIGGPSASVTGARGVGGGSVAAVPPVPPPQAEAAVAAERTRCAAILAAAKPGQIALAQIAVAQGWTADVFGQAQAAAEASAAATAQAAYAASFPPPVATGPAPTAAPATEAERLRAEWDGSQALQAEFGGSFDAFTAFRRAEAAGRVRVLSRPTQRAAG